MLAYELAKKPLSDTPKNPSTTAVDTLTAAMDTMYWRHSYFGGIFLLRGLCESHRG